jgi:hypothetical protein
MVVNRLEPLGYYLHPAHDLLPGNAKTMPLVDCALSVKRKVIEVFAHRDLNEQFSGCQTFHLAHGSRYHHRWMTLVLLMPILRAEDSATLALRRIHLDFKSLFLVDPLVGFGMGFHFIRLDDFFFKEWKVFVVVLTAFSTGRLVAFYGDRLVFPRSGRPVGPSVH